MPQVTIDQAMGIAMSHRQAGRLQQAEEIYRQILAQSPQHAPAMYQLGLIAQQAGRNDIAIDLIRRAINLDPNFAQPPSRAEAFYNLAVALRAHGQVDEAIAAYRQSIALWPNLPEAHSNLGNALVDRGRVDEAVACYRKAIVLRPNYAEALNNLANALKDDGKLDEAIAAFQKAIALRPDLSEVHSNLGETLVERGDIDHAVAAFRRAIALRPDYAEAHNNLGLALLTRGDYLEAWEEHEWRWKYRGFPSEVRGFVQPQWDGSPLQGRTLLLHAEQGLGDTLQFIRYLPLVSPGGGKIVLECQPQLQRLLSANRGECQVVARGQPLPPFDVHCPLLSLPRVFQTTPGSIPANVPYVVPDPRLIEHWRGKLPLSTAGPNVALAWAGNPNFKRDRTRSIALDRLAPLAEARGVTFFSLQKGEAARQVDHPPPGLRLVDLSPELHDFADTAAVMALMDLVITTDTSVAHLAGALGRPAWVMLQFVPDWRWFPIDRKDTAWYPTMRLFRQPSRGDWDSVIKRVVEELARWIVDRS